MEEVERRTVRIKDREYQYSFAEVCRPVSDTGRLKLFAVSSSVRVKHHKIELVAARFKAT